MKKIKLKKLLKEDIDFDNLKEVKSIVDIKRGLDYIWNGTVADIKKAIDVADFKPINLERIDQSIVKNLYGQLEGEVCFKVNGRDLLYALEQNEWITLRGGWLTDGTNYYGTIYEI